MKQKSRPWVEACNIQPCFLSQATDIIFWRQLFQDDSIMTMDLLCAYRRPAFLYLFAEDYSDIATEHGNGQLKT